MQNYLLINLQHINFIHPIYTTQSKFCNSYKHVFFLFWRNIETNVHLKEPFYLLTQRPDRMVVVCLVKRLLDEHKESDPLNVIKLLFYLTSKQDIWMKSNLYVLMGVGWCGG